MSRYLGILSRRAALLPFLAAVVARLPVSMAPLGMVLLVQQVRGSYSIAGGVSAAFAFGAALSAPLWGRLMDRRGQSVVIGPTSVTGGVLLAVLAVAAVEGAPDVALVALAGAVGLSFPPQSAAMRAAWRSVLPDEADRAAAYALDAVAVESIFVGGPLLLSLLLVLVPPAVPLLVTAVLLAAGGAAYAATGAARSWTPERVPGADGGGRRGRSPLVVPAVLSTLLVATGLAVGFGLSDVAIAAAAGEVLGSQARVGLLFAAIAGGSATGGLWYGSRSWTRPDHLRLPVSLGGFATGLTAVGLLLASGHTALGVLLPLLFCTGLSVAPSLIMLANLVDRHGPADRLGEAQSWLSTSFTTGGALGTGIAGVAVDAAGAPRAFLLAGAAVAVAVLVAASIAVLRPRERPAATPAPRGRP